MAGRGLFRGQGLDAFASRTRADAGAAPRAHVLGAFTRLHGRSVRYERVRSCSTRRVSPSAQSHRNLCPCLSLSHSCANRPASPLPTTNDNASPAKSRAHRRYFRAPLPAHVEMRGRYVGTWQRAVTTAIRISSSQTFEVRAAVSLTTDASVTALPHLHCVCSYIVCFYAAISHRSGRLCRCSGGSTRTRRAPERVFASPGGTAPPSTSSSTCSGGSSDGTPSARTRATRPQSPRAGPFLPSPLSLPATHSSPAGAGRCGRRRRATPRERRPSPASRCRHRRARWRGHAAVALRPHVRPRGPGECGGRPRSSSCAIMCVLRRLSVMKK